MDFRMTIYRSAEPLFSQADISSASRNVVSPGPFNAQNRTFCPQTQRSAGESVPKLSPHGLKKTLGACMLPGMSAGGLH
jgi:hypothetical protein